MPKQQSIDSFTELYNHAVTDRSWLSHFLSGHLMVEFMLRKLIGQYDVNLKSLSDKMRHFELIQLNQQIGNINEAQANVLLSINKIRNRLAHEITFTPSVMEMKSIWEAVAASFDDLTDGISQGLEEMEIEGELRTLDSWVFSELFIQIAYDLHDTYISLGGDDEVFS